MAIITACVVSEDGQHDELLQAQKFSLLLQMIMSLWLLGGGIGLIRVFIIDEPEACMPG